MIRRLSTFQRDVGDRLSVDGSLSVSQDSISRQIDPVEESSESPTGKSLDYQPTVHYEDTRTRDQRTQRTRTTNLPSRPSDNFRNVTRAKREDVISQKAVTSNSQPKYKYVIIPESLLGIRLDKGTASALQQSLKGAGLGASIGSAVPVIGNVVGGVVGGIGGIFSKVFGFGENKIWFDVVYKDSIQKAFESMGLKITDKPFGGNSMTVKSQFGVDSPISVKNMKTLIAEINQRIGKEFSSNPDIVSGLANVRISDSYNERQTVFRFAVEYPKAEQPEDAQKTSIKSSGSIKKTVGIASLIGILLSLR